MPPVLLGLLLAVSASLQDPAAPPPADAGFRSENVGLGPLRLGSLSPFQSLRYGLPPRMPSSLGEGGLELRVAESWVNLWALSEGRHKIDYEILQTSLSASYALSDSVELELGFVGRSRFGGVMDGLIQGFHDLFNVDQGGRDSVPKGDFALEILRPDGGVAVLDADDRGPFSDALLVTVQHDVTHGGDDAPAVALAATVRAELGGGDDFDESQLLDLSVSLSLSKRLGDVHAYLGLGVAWYGDERFLGIELRSTQLSSLLALEWRIAPSACLLIQYLVTEGVATDLEDFSHPSHEITLGAQLEVAPLAVLEIGLIENVITSDNSPDFGVHVGLRLRR